MIEGSAIPVRRMGRTIASAVSACIVCLLAALFVAGCGGSAEGDLKVSGPGVETPTQDASEDGSTPDVRIQGEAATPYPLGDITWTYVSARRSELLESGGRQEKTPGAFVVVKLTAEAAKAAAAIDQGQFRLQDSMGRTFFASAKSWILEDEGLMPYPGPETPLPPWQIITRTLQPEEEATGSVAFEVPLDAKELELTITDQRAPQVVDPRDVTRLSNGRLIFKVTFR